ncbi:hypothetical protein ACTTAI_14950 [Rhodobacter capsulatus]|uniref:hypothetical protein n=1 Tax=Rhodobacter capsulatus TaxID=1061 RepID=UPI0040276144
MSPEDHSHEPPRFWERLRRRLSPAAARREARLAELRQQIDRVRDKALQVVAHAGEGRERWLLLQEEDLDLAVSEMRILAAVTMQAEFILRAQSQRTRHDTLPEAQLIALSEQLAHTLAALEDLRTAAALSALKARHGLLMAHPEPLGPEGRRPEAPRPAPQRAGKTRVLNGVPAGARPLTTAV